MSSYRVIILCFLAACGGDGSLGVSPGQQVELSFAKPITTPDSVVFTLGVRNPTGSRVEVPLYGPENWAFDLEIRSEEGGLVWRRLRGYSAFPGVTRSLSPGESFQLEVGWDLRTHDGAAVPSGKYTVKAFLTARDATRQEAPRAQTFTVPPGSG